MDAAKGRCWFTEYSCCSCCCCYGPRLMTIQRSECLVEDSSEGLCIVHFEKKSCRCFVAQTAGRLMLIFAAWIITTFFLWDWMWRCQRHS